MVLGGGHRPKGVAMKTLYKDKVDVQAMLEEELDRLRWETGLRGSLRVIWSPDPHSVRHGEVKGSTILVYDEDPEDALRTLRHEFLDHHISREVIDPLVQYLNLQKKLIENLIYERKEKIIEGITNLLPKQCKG